MAFTPYVTVPEFKAWITLTDNIDDVVMAGILESVTEWIDEACDRHFWQDGTVGSPVARTFTPCYSSKLDIDDLVSVTTFKTDESGDGTFETTWSASDYQLLPVNRPTGRPYTKVETVAGRMFPIRYDTSTRANRVEITGVWGWTTVPAPVKQACLEQANRELKRRYSPEGVAGFGEFGLVRVSRALDSDVARNLDPYKRHGVLIA